MSVVDFLLKALIRRLQKTQKARKKHKIARRRSLKKSRRLIKKKILSKRRKRISRRGRKKKRSARRPLRKSLGRKRPSLRKPKARLALRKKTGARPKAKRKAGKKTEKRIAYRPDTKIIPQEICIGEITHYFSRIQVVVLKMTKGSLSVGEQIHIKGRSTDFLQKVASLQIESIDVKVAHKGQLVGLKVDKAAKVGSKVYK